MINLYNSNGTFLVWNVEDIVTLRKHHRIVGSLIGQYPIHSFQVLRKWLPLKLLPEEARLLVEKGYAQMMSIQEKVEDAAVIENFFATREKLCEEQVDLLKENRKQEILDKIDVIYEGKKRKFLKESLENKKKLKENTINQPQESNTNDATDKISSSSEPCPDGMEGSSNLTESLAQNESSEQDDESRFTTTKEEIIEAMFSEIPEADKEICMVQLFTECPWKITNLMENWKYPYTQTEKLRYAVFRDLWGKGYYVTSAMKFGGDFLVYEGDPLKFHALFIVICLESSQRFRGQDIVVYGRLGQNVKKTVTLASLNEAGEVDYISINWNHEML